MILRMSRRKQGFQCSPLNAEDLSILDIGIRILRLVVVLEDLGLRAEALQIRQTADMVAVPVSEQGLVYGSFLVGKDGLQLLGPSWLALAGVDEDALVSAANEIGVGSWGMSEYTVGYLGLDEAGHIPCNVNCSQHQVVFGPWLATCILYDHIINSSQGITHLPWVPAQDPND